MSDQRDEPEFNYRYSIIPGRAATDRRLKGCDLRLLALLGRHTKRSGWCIRSQVEMAKELGVGRATVYRAILRLVELGYIETKASGRGRAQPDPDKQPFSSFWYRVRIDQPESDAAASDHVPTNGHHGDKVENGHDLPRQSGHQVPTPERAPLEGSSQGSDSNTSARAKLEARWKEVWTAFQCWDCDQGGWSEERTKVVARRIIDQLPEIDPLIDCIAAEGRAIEASKQRRRGNSEKPWPHPHNWLDRDRGWQKHLEIVIAEPQRVAAAVEKANVLRQVLGEETIAKLRRAGVSQTLIDQLQGARFEAGPPPRLIVPLAFMSSRLDGAMMRLTEEFGNDFKIVVEKVAA